jgi:hypothetical protein
MKRDLALRIRLTSRQTRIFREIHACRKTNQLCRGGSPGARPERLLDTSPLPAIYLAWHLRLRSEEHIPLRAEQRVGEPSAASQVKSEARTKLVPCPEFQSTYFVGY